MCIMLRGDAPLGEYSLRGAREPVPVAQGAAPGACATAEPPRPVRARWSAPSHSGHAWPVSPRLPGKPPTASWPASTARAAPTTYLGAYTGCRRASRISSSFSASDKSGNEARNSASVPLRKAFIDVMSVEIKKISGWVFFTIPMNSESVIRSKVAQGEGRLQ